MDGNPMSGCMLAIDRIPDDGSDPVTLDNVHFESAIIDIKAEGGCAVIQTDFQPVGAVFYQKAKRMCREWLMGNRRTVLSLLVSPYLLNGCIYVLFQRLVYAYGHEKADGGFRFLLAFDNTATIPCETEDVDYAEVVREVEAELKRQEDGLYDELEEAKKEERMVKGASTFDFSRAVADEYSPDNPDTRNTAVDKGDIRSGRQYRGIRVSRREEE